MFEPCVVSIARIYLLPGNQEKATEAKNREIQPEINQICITTMFSCLKCHAFAQQLTNREV